MRIRHKARSLKQVPWKYKWGAILFGGWWIWYEERPDKPTTQKS